MTVSFEHMTLQGGAFVLAVALLRAVTLNKLPKRCFVWLWAAALARFLLPLGLPILKVQARGPVPVPAAESGGDGGVYRFLWVLWLAAAAVMAGYFAWTHIRCRRELRAAVPVDSDPAALETLGRRVELRTLRGLSTPLTYGVIRPVIVMPEGTDLDGGGGRLALLHELCHVRRFDAALKGLAALALCLHWFNPAAWLLYALLTRDMELACDEAVLTGISGDGRREYALALLDFEARRDGLAPRAVAFGRNVAEERIRCIMKFKKKSTLAISMAIAVAAIGTVTAFAAGSENKDVLIRKIGPSGETIEAVPVETGYYSFDENGIDLDGAKSVQINIKEDGTFEFAGVEDGEGTLWYEYKGTVDGEPDLTGSVKYRIVEGYTGE